MHNVNIAPLDLIILDVSVRLFVLLRGKVVVTALASELDRWVDAGHASAY